MIISPFLETWWVLFTVLELGTAEYDPVLSWDVCSPSRIVVTLTGGIDGGIIYIRGYGSACKQDTLSVETRHEFEFDACGIEKAETYFTIIVQKNPLYQTGNDLQESLICIYDLSDISVGNGLDVGAKDDDIGVNKTVKPTATMKLYKNGVDIGGGDVKLTDRVTMTIQIDDEFIEDFDIKAKSCRANFIDITQEFFVENSKNCQPSALDIASLADIFNVAQKACATETDLFPNFVHVTQGVVTSTFGAFRTTDLGGGYVEMVFTCTVQVCRGLCTEEQCGEEMGRSRKKKREAKEEEVAFEDLNVGTSMSVGTDIDLTPIGKDNEEKVCITHLAFILGLLVILLVIVFSMSLAVVATGKLLKRTEELRKLSRPHENEGQSINSKLRMERGVILSNTNIETVILKTSNLDGATNNQKGMTKVNIDGINSLVDRTTRKMNSEADYIKERSKASGEATQSEQLTETDLNHLKKCRDMLKVMEFNNTNIQNKKQRT